jgi:D-alanyl-lipoteichoic acid acyltransferase DltB (MBOAT superfamily)
MLFNSPAFLIFFPVVTILYFCAPQRLRWVLLLAASSIFYMAFVPVYILILAVTILVDYAAGIGIEASHGARRRLMLVASLVANIGALAVFKYYGFAQHNLGALAAHFRLGNPLPPLAIVLPIGLSFHTFQAMSYTLEVYYGRQRAERHLGIYALYVMFYPQLVAGPIERPQNLLHQFRERHAFEYERVVAGLKRMALGMFKKVALADTLALVVDRVYGAPAAYHGPALIAATVFFSFQIYYDFAGYSDIALGAAQVMGFELMNNFDTPYFSASTSEFWRRWHISLSTWFRDYVYVPLGGSRVSRGKHYRNLAVVFLLSGLWHGAGWTYVIWGGLHGCFLICGDATRRLRARLPVPRVVSVLTTFALVAFGWIFFRARTLGDAWYVVTHAFSGFDHGMDDLGRDELTWPLLALAGVLCIDWIERAGGVFEKLARHPAPLRFAAYMLFVYGSLLGGSWHKQQQFIYFQF